MSFACLLGSMLFLCFLFNVECFHSNTIILVLTFTERVHRVLCHPYSVTYYHIIRFDFDLRSHQNLWNSNNNHRHSPFTHKWFSKPILKILTQIRNQIHMALIIQYSSMLLSLIPVVYTSLIKNSLIFSHIPILHTAHPPCPASPSSNHVSICVSCSCPSGSQLPPHFPACPHHRRPSLQVSVWYVWYIRLLFSPNYISNIFLQCPALSTDLWCGCDLCVKVCEWFTQGLLSVIGCIKLIFVQSLASSSVASSLLSNA